MSFKITDCGTQSLSIFETFKISSQKKKFPLPMTLLVQQMEQ